MQGHSHGFIASDATQIDVQGLRYLVDGGLGGAIRVPTSSPIIRDTSYSCGHHGENGVVWQAVLGLQIGHFSREEGTEIFHQEQWTKCVDLEHLQGLGIVDLRR